MKTFNIFTYGTLMPSSVFKNFAPDENIERSVANLEGYNRYPVRNAHFPGILPEEGGQVTGVLYRNVPIEFLERLDRYEGVGSGLYTREEVTVTVPVDEGKFLQNDDAGEYQCYVYVWGSRKREGEECVH